MKSLITLPLLLISGTWSTAARIPGSWTKERWNSITWQQVTGATVANPFIAPPDSVALTGSTASDTAQNFIDRTRGTVTAPVAGLYTFWLEGDDIARLALSSDATKWNARGIAEVTSWVAPGKYDEQSGQRSASVYLAEGETRFVEILHQQGVGSAHTGVAWMVQPVAAGTAQVNWAAAAQGAVATQSSNYTSDFPASKSIDGNAATYSITGNQPGSWLLVDFRQDRVVSRVELLNRTDILSRLSNFRVTVEDSRGLIAASKDFYKESGHVGVSEMWELAAPVAARRIRIQFLGPNRAGNYYLHPAEVRAWGPDLEVKNWTREPGATASLSSTYGNLGAALSFDGNYDTFSSTNGEVGSSLVADLGANRPIDSVEIFNRRQGNVGTRLSNFRVSILDSAGGAVATRDVVGPVKNSWRWDLDAPVTGRKVKVEIPGTNLYGDSFLSISELNVLGGNHPTHRAVRETIPASAMATYDPASDDDADDDWMRDFVELALGLDPTDPSDAYGDLDGDGFWNAFELQKGNNPAQWDSIAGVLLEEVWDDLPGEKNNVAIDKAISQRVADRTFTLTSTTSAANHGDHYASRIRGYLTAPVSGNYQFWAAGDDDVDFLLSTDDSKFNRKRIIDKHVNIDPNLFDQDISQKSPLIALEAGQKYFFEIRHKESYAAAHFSIAWKTPGGQRQIIPAQFLGSFPGDPKDRDGDDLKDDYEIANSLDPNSAVGINGAYGDLDGDGLSNLEEMQHGTKANAADSDGDGTNDYDEVNFFGSETLANDIGAFQPVAMIAGDAYTAAFGEFLKANGTARQNGRRGSVTYPVTVPTAGIHALKFTISSIADGTRSEDYEFDVKLDGKRIGYKTIQIAPDGTGTLALLTPWLDSGRTHDLEIYVDNSYNWRRVSIDQLQVLKAGGTDSNANGTPDWVEIRLNGTNGFDKAVQYSKTSPAQVEGRVKHFDFLESNGTAITKAPDGRFFTHVPLEAGVPKELGFSFENGGKSDSTTIHWLPTNLLVETSITIVEGDSLLLTAFQNAENAGAESYEICVDGQTYSAAASQFSTVLFAIPGLKTVSLIHTATDGATQTTRNIEVNVLAKVQIESPVCIVGYPRQWTHLPLPGGASFVVDSSVTMWQESTGNIWTIKTSTPLNQPLIIRYQGSNGLILGGSKICSASVKTSDLTGCEGEVLGDYLITKMPIIAYGEISEIEISCQIIISGVTFEDGGTTKTINAPDLDAYGVATLIFKQIQSAQSNCHKVKIKHNNQQIAEFN